MRILQVAARLTVGSIFCASGFLKVLNMNGFVESLMTYELLPNSIIGIAAIVVPLVELIFGLLFVLGVKTRLIAWILLGQVMVFTSFGFAAFIQGRMVDCGCFPVAGVKETIGAFFFLRNTVLAITCLLIAKSSGKSEDSVNQVTAEAF